MAANDVKSAFDTGLSKTDWACYLFLIFMLGCLVGWLYEEVFYWVTEGMLRNRGILYGPWLPIYGIGALVIYALKPLKKNPVLLFALIAVASGVVEYVIGWVGVNCLDLRLWDYRGLFMNIDGLVCLRSVLSFAIMGVVFHYLLEPIGFKLFKKVPPKTMQTICLVLVAIFVVDCIVSLMFRTPITY